MVDAQVQGIWDSAWDEFLNSLSEEDRANVESTGSVDDMLHHVQALRVSYHASRLIRTLDRLQPILRWLRSYNECMKVYIEGSPRPLILLWGSITLLIEIVTREHRALEQVVAALEEVYRHGPRFHYYTIRLAGGTYERLKAALIQYHTELIGLCHDSITFFRAGPKKNLLHCTFKPFIDKIEPRVNRLRGLTTWVDQEAAVASSERWNRRYDALNQDMQGILRLLNPQNIHLSSAMLVTGSFQNLPPRHRQICYGRDAELSRLEHHLRANEEREALQTAFLCGMRGVGKSHLALEFAYNHVNDYMATLWISAESSLKLQESISVISHNLGIADDSIQHPDQLHGDKNGSKWLVIFDNVEDTSLLELYWPLESNGSVIITTTNEDVARYYLGGDRMIVMEPFSVEIGIHLLLRVTNTDESNLEEKAAAELITNALGHLPLALDLVGNYVRDLGKPLSSFWREHPHFERDFLFNPELTKWSPTYFEKSISRIWALHIYPNTQNTGGHLDVKSYWLINMLAFLDKDGVTLDLFQNTTREAMLFEGPDRPDEIENLEGLVENPFNQVLVLNGAIMNLRNRALVKINDDTNHISCHRLVRHAVLKSMNKNTKLETFNQVVFLLNASFPTQEDGKPLHSKWKSCETLANQVSTLLYSSSLYTTEIGHPILLCEVAVRCAWYFLELGRYHAAGKMAEQAISICNLALQEKSHLGYSVFFIQDMISHHFNVLATIERQRPGPDFGISLSEKVRDIRVRNRRPSNPQDDMWIAAAEGNLAVSLMASGRATEAYEILLRLRQRDDMKANLDAYLRNSCLCLLILGRVDEAMAVNDEALDTATAKRGESSEQVAICYFDLANIHIRRGNTSAALNALQECLNRRKASMPLHEVTAFTLHKIGDVVATEKDYRSSMQQALAILTCCECHPGAICRTAFALASACQLEGDEEKYTRYIQLGKFTESGFSEDEKSVLETTPEYYDRFVQVGLR
ncbi:uncharacterized protein GGS22DRAFT_179230 [Annulohypoxylon maeteangense]|uniref:uncharacterized protein n=1 Tax=Annulohypoxylon maeteangense TaxID=1927788 RepID=UPI00200762D6|nr:uncharacterized protein GGS22DRAFT_179230 [Annulohypoxylon maeteangense]KAI0886344.1 hypothetical protein GGS22DRAFT_179230 [Annulohypoxylon maeteangense]